MSDLVSVRSGSSFRLSYLALALALASVVVWVLAGTVDDGLYVVTGALGVAAFVLGLKARRDDRRVGLRGRLPLLAMSVGGLLGAGVIVFTVAWGISHLV